MSLDEQVIAHSTALKSEHRCANCGAPVTGRFCSNCGQRLESPVHSVWHFAAEAAEDLTHADSRVWATLLALLFKPGVLTQKFLEGQRVRYLPPLRLYLVMSVVFFLFATFWPASTSYVVGVSIPDRGSMHVVAEPLGAERNRTGTRDEQQNQVVCTDFKYTGAFEATVNRAVRNACHSLADNGRSLREAVLHAFPRAMFIFLPVLALVMLALYWHPRHFYVEHLLLLIHNHAFVFLSLTCWEVLRHLLSSRVVDVSLTLALVVYAAWYVYKSMRRVYGQGRWLTFSKMVVMAVAYAICALVMVAATAFYAAVTLTPS